MGPPESKRKPSGALTAIFITGRRRRTGQGVGTARAVLKHGRREQRAGEDTHSLFLPSLSPLSSTNRRSRGHKATLGGMGNAISRHNGSPSLCFTPEFSDKGGRFLAAWSSEAFSRKRPGSTGSINKEPLTQGRSARSQRPGRKTKQQRAPRGGGEAPGSSPGTPDIRTVFVPPFARADPPTRRNTGEQTEVMGLFKNAWPSGSGCGGASS